MKATFYRLNALITRITYKPGTRFSVHLFPGDRVANIVIELSVYNADNPDEWTKLASSAYINEFDLRESDGHIVNRILKRIRGMEEHETDEFFRVDGKHWNNPHPEKEEQEQIHKKTVRDL